MPRRSQAVTVIKVTCGNFLEMFDFFLFGFYAAYIGAHFFPSGNLFYQQMAAFTTFAAGFLMRPLGAIILGAYIDRIGRRRGLILTLSIMALGTMVLAFVPGYATIGIAAPILIVAGRLLQGFSAGVELGGVSVYLSEMAPPGRKGFYVSWQSASQQLAIVAAALIGYTLHKTLDPAQMAAWGWRIPFVLGCLLVPFMFIIRRSLTDTEAFLARQHHPSVAEIARSMAGNWALVLAGMALVVMTTVSFYVITVYTPTFGSSVLRLSMSDSLLVTLCVGLSNFIWLPVSGALSDRTGRWPVMIAATALAIATVYPALAWLTTGPSFGKMLAVELWLSLLYAFYNGAALAALTELMPVEVRTTGFSLAYSLATALGGSSLAISTWLIHATGDKAAPGYWMSFAALCGLSATAGLYRRPGAAAPARQRL